MIIQPLAAFLFFGGAYEPSPSAAPSAAIATASILQEKLQETPQDSIAASVAASIETRIPPAVQVRGEEHYFTLAERMAEHRVPAVSIAVFENDEIVWAGAYGLAEPGIPATVETMFQAASISKPVNGLAAALMVEQGKLDFDKPINDYLKAWKLPSNALTKATPVTARHLLTHTAGTTVHGFGGYPTGSPVPTLVQLLDGEQPANSPPVRVDLKPGTERRYSGGGISIVQMAMVEIMGAPYPEILESLVLNPLKMTNSTFAQPLPAALLGKAAAGHLGDGSVVPTKRHVYPEMAAAGLWTTPSDLARFLIALSAGRKGDGSVISKEVAMNMTDPAVPATGPGAEIGISMFLFQQGGQWMFGHGGANEGFRCNAMASRDGGFGVVVMTNSDNGSALAEEIERALFARPGWPSEDPIERVAIDDELRKQLPGRFTMGPGNPLEIAIEAKRIELRLPFRPAVELVPIAGSEFISLDDGARVRFGPEGRNLIATMPDGRVFVAERMADDAQAPLIELAAGRFDGAVSAWRKIEEAEPGSPALDEVELNALGYELLGEGDNESALTVLRFVTAVRPSSSNAFDSLGEAHAIRGETVQAIAAYKKSLALLDADESIPAEAKRARRTQSQEMLSRLRKPGD